jgi:beta-glucosidase
VHGYFVWSPLENSEWSQGFSQRFGLGYVNHASQERTTKDSGYWVKELIAHNRPHA